MCYKIFAGKNAPESSQRDTDVKSKYFKTGTFETCGWYLTLDCFFFKCFARHGNKCAGVIAAEANNNVCGVGLAYNAKIAGELLV